VEAAQAAMAAAQGDADAVLAKAMAMLRDTTFD
jgi:hypothetical protein